MATADTQQDEQNPLYDTLMNRQAQGQVGANNFLKGDQYSAPGSFPGFPGVQGTIPAQPGTEASTSTDTNNNGQIQPISGSYGVEGQVVPGSVIESAPVLPGVAGSATWQPPIPSNGNYQQWFQGLMGGANDQASLLSHRAELEAAGWHISPPNVNGEITKVQDPSGQWIRVIGNGEGHPVYIGQGTAGVNTGGLTRPFGTGIDSTKSNQLFDMLMQRANQSLNVNRNDPAVRRQVDAYGATQERSRRNYLQDLAENSGPNANISAETRASAEKVGQNTAGFEGSIMQQEINARRQEIMSALSGMQGNLSAEQQLQLQEELQQMALAQQAYQFDANQEYLRSPLAPGAQG